MSSQNGEYGTIAMSQYLDKEQSQFMFAFLQWSLQFSFTDLTENSKKIMFTLPRERVYNHI